MLCQICGKNPATVHFTEIHDNTMSEIHVCERCAQEKNRQRQPTSASQHGEKPSGSKRAIVIVITRAKPAMQNRSRAGIKFPARR